MQAGQEVLSNLRRLHHGPSPQLQLAESSWTREAGSSPALLAGASSVSATHQSVLAGPSSAHISKLARVIQACSHSCL